MCAQTTPEKYIFRSRTGKSKWQQNKKGCCKFLSHIAILACNALVLDDSFDGICVPELEHVSTSKLSRTSLQTFQ